MLCIAIKHYDYRIQWNCNAAHSCTQEAGFLGDLYRFVHKDKNISHPNVLATPLLSLNDFHSLLIPAPTNGAMECASVAIIVAVGELLSQDCRTAWTPLAQLCR